MPTNSREILVVGGAGYIGSHMLLTLRSAGYRPIVLDNLSTGHQDAVLDNELIVGDMGDGVLLEKIFKEHQFLAVMHFASFIEVAESVKLPIKYYQNNVSATLNLLDVMLKHQVKNFIFSSTAAVYGEPKATTINEQHVCQPINPYGRSKWMVEEIIRDLEKSDQLKYAILRYFNAAGADPSGRAAERHEPESHLIPIILQVAAGLRQHITVYGEKYPTTDGTCIRDYIHVVDICNAHLLALQNLTKGKNILCNLGTGQGYSVMQVINAARRITGHPIPVIKANARAGDSAILVADAKLAREALNWRPKYPALETILQHAWAVTQKKAI